MKTLSDLIDERANDLDIQKVLAIPKNEIIVSESWKKAKKYINELVANYTDLLKVELKENYFNVKNYKNGSYKTISWYKQIEGHLILFEIIEDENGSVRKVRYVAFNDNKNIIYQRDVIQWKKD